MSNTLSHAHNNFLCYKYDWHIQKFNDESRDSTIHGVIPKNQSRSVYQHLPYYIQAYLLYVSVSLNQLSREHIFLWYAVYNIVYIDNKPRYNVPMVLSSQDISSIAYVYDILQFGLEE